jgi:hypothetical protein
MRPQDLTAAKNGGEDQRGQQHGGQEEERATPIHRS